MPITQTSQTIVTYPFSDPNPSASIYPYFRFDGDSFIGQNGKSQSLVVASGATIKITSH